MISTRHEYRAGAGVRCYGEAAACARVRRSPNSLLFLLGVRRLAALFGPVPNRITLVSVAVFPYQAAFSFRSWGDLIAGHGVLYLLILLVETQREIHRSGKADRSRLILIGATSRKSTKQVLPRICASRIIGSRRMAFVSARATAPKA